MGIVNTQFMVLCWRTAPINHTLRHSFVFLPNFYFLLCLVIKWEREEGAVGTGEQQGWQGGVSRVTVFMDCQLMAWVTASSSCLLPSQRLQPQFKIISHRDSLSQAGGSQWPKSVATPGTAVAVSSCRSDGLEMLTKFLCTEAPICFLLEPIYALNSSPE